MIQPARGRLARLVSALVLTAAVLAGAPVRAEDPAQLAAALKAGAGGDWGAADAAAARAGRISSDIVTWTRLRAGVGAFVEYQDFLARNPDWPGLPLLQKKGEEAIGPDVPAQAVIAYFAPRAPQTGAGALALARALAAAGRTAEAQEAAIRGWRSFSLTPEEETAYLSAFGPALAEHHGGRIAALLKEGDLEGARRMLPLVPEGTRRVAEARIALQTDAAGVDSLIKAVPERMMSSAGLALDRFRWRLRKGLTEDAIALMLERSESAEMLGDPESWGTQRRRLARLEMREGDPRRAYRLAARHFLTTGEDYADLEWLSGYIALRKLGDGETALRHFARFEAAVASPISLGRAYYWQGRAYESLGRAAEAREAYQKGARHQTAFYGLMSAEKLGLPLDPALAGRETYPDWRQGSFVSSSVFQAAVLLRAAGDELVSTRFLLHLNESLGREDAARLMGLAQEWDAPFTTLMIAKAEAEKGNVWPAAYFPLNGAETLDLPVPKPLALSITRRESEFYMAAQSPVGALGLMQVMPDTAKEVAGKIGLPFERRRLTTDGVYNTRLGTAYLAQLRERFGPSPLLVASGYNAGPSRPSRWIEALGDPGDDAVDVVDWLEHIPIQETQTYVMRVTEGIIAYRERLGIGGGPVRITDILRGRH